MEVTLVCQDWAAAAVLANTHEEVSLLDQHACQRFQEWLQQHGGRLQHLSAGAEECSCGDGRTQIPWQQLSQLVSLRLRSLQLEQPPASISTHESAAALATASHSGSNTVLSAPAAAAAGFLPQLQQLELVSCKMPLTPYFSNCPGQAASPACTSGTQTSGATTPLCPQKTRDVLRHWLSCWQACLTCQCWS